MKIIKSKSTEGVSCRPRGYYESRIVNVINVREDEISYNHYSYAVLKRNYGDYAASNAVRHALYVAADMVNTMLSKCDFLEDFEFSMTLEGYSSGYIDEEKGIIVEYSPTLLNGELTGGFVVNIF